MDAPVDGNWLPWIITIGVSVIGTMAATIAGMAKLMRETYLNTINELKQRVERLETQGIDNQKENTLLREENAGLRARLEFLDKRIEF